MKRIVFALALVHVAGVLFAGEFPGWNISGDSDCSPCNGGAEAATGSLDVSTFLHIDLGPGLQQKIVGSLVLRAGLPAAELCTPAGLQLNYAPSSYEALDVRRLNGQIHQVSAPRVFINVTNHAPYHYTVRVMLKEAQGSLGADGFYEWNDNAAYLIRTFDVLNPDFATNYSRLRISDLTVGTNAWNYEYSNSLAGWKVTLPANIGSVELISTNHATDAWTLIKRHRNPSSQVIAEQSQVYSNFTWGIALLSETHGVASEARTRRYSYYSSVPFTPTQSQPPLATTEEPTGAWKKVIQYDSEGRILVEHAGIDTGVTDDANLCQKTVYSYASEDGSDDLSRDSDQPRRVDEYWKNTLIKRTYHVYTHDSHRVIECPNPANAIGHSDNLITETIYQYDTTRILRTSAADGTATLTTTTTDYDGIRTTVTDHGEYDSGAAAIVNGSRTETIVSPIGTATSQKSWAISQGNLGPLTASTIYTDFDSFGRASRINHIDGRSELIDYACCGADTQTDRDGVVTQYWYDALKRVVATTRLGITTSNIIDTAGRNLAMIRIGTDGSRVTNNIVVYNTASIVIVQTNALNGVTLRSQSLLGGTLWQEISTLPNGGQITNTYFADGTLSNTIGTATFPVRYEYGIESDGTVQRLCVKTIKLDLNGSPTSEWTKSYVDGLGRNHKIVYSAASGTPNIQSFYNNKGQLWKQIDPDGVRTLFQYNSEGELQYTVLDLDQDDIIDFSGSDRITERSRSVVAAAGGKPDLVRTDEYVWKDGNATTTGTLVSRTEVSTDGLRSWRTVYADGSTPVTSQTWMVYSTSGNRYLTNSAPDGSYTLTTYLNGRVVSDTKKSPSHSQIVRTTYGYDAHGRQNTVTDARNGVTTSAFSGADLLVSITTPVPAVGQLSQTTLTHYDKMLQVTNTIQPDGGSTTNEYYLTGLLKKTAGARTYPVEYTYDHAGRMKTMKTWQNFAGNTGTAITTWNYNQYRGWLESKDYANASTGAAGTTGPDYTYTAGGRIKTRQWARLGTSSQRVLTTYKYGFDDSASGNQHDDLTEIIYSNDPQSTPSVGIGYSRQGLANSISQGSATTTLTYNEASQQLTEAYSGGTLSGLSVTNGYDHYLRRTNVTALNGAIILAQSTFGYDTVSRLRIVSDGVNKAVYSYLANSPLVENIWFTNNTTFRMKTAKSYDLLNRLTAVQTVNALLVPFDSFGYTYNHANQRTRRNEADGSYWAYEYDQLGQVKRGAKFFNDGYPVPGQQFEYGHDDIGNRKFTQAGGGDSGAGLRLANYTPDRLNQYASRDVAGGFDVVGMTLGNTTVTVNSQTPWRKDEYYRKELSVANSSAAVWQSVSVAATGETTVNGNVFVAQTPEAFTYDADGNLTQDGRWSYTWDAENRLVKVESLSSNPTASKRRVVWEYDHKGRRIRQTTSTGASGTYVVTDDLKFLADGWRHMVELNAANNAVLRSYVWGHDLSGSLDGAGGVGGLLMLNSAANGVHYYAYDANGNVSTLVKATDGTVSQRCEYELFGKLIRNTGLMANENRFMFSTKRSDAATDLVLYEYRVYNPDSGRWLSRDPIAETGGDNLYFFVGNDAPNTVDVLGLKCYKLTHTIGIGGIRKSGIVGDERGTNTTHSAKGMGVGFYGEGGIDLSAEVCETCCPNGKRGYKISGEALASVTIGASLASHAFAADVTFPLGGGWSVSGGVNAWVGARVYGQFHGKGGGAINYSTCGGTPSLNFKLKVGGEVGVEFGGQATAYLTIRRGWMSYSIRPSVGIAGGGRLGMEWDADVSCNLQTCTISGPIQGYAEGYVRAVFLGFNADFSVGGKKHFGNMTVVTGSPLSVLPID